MAKRNVPTSSCTTSAGTILETHCDRMDCHGTHVERIEWEIARRRSDELGTIEVMAELDDYDRKTILWVAYITYARNRYGASGSAPAIPTKPDVIVPKSVREAGFDLADVCWACDDPECRICTVPEGSSRLQQVILREEGGSNRGIPQTRGHDAGLPQRRIRKGVGG